MKKIYVAPEMKVIIVANDIIATSGVSFGSGDTDRMEIRGAFDFEDNGGTGFFDFGEEF